MRRFSLLIIVLLCGTFSVLAQTSVRGKITDSKNGAPVAGASVKVRGEKASAVSLADGSFELKSESNSGVLEVSEIGHNAQTIKFSGSKSIEILMLQNTQGLSEVVVTAFGVKRDKKALGYSSQEIKSADLNQADQSNALSALGGKVAGLQVINSSGTPGAAAFIRLRGITSLGGGEPLIVVDGVPIDNSTTGSTLGNVAQSNRAVDINPDDVESVTILKGPAASSLYGTQGSDGVILITTKRGKKGRKFNMTYNYGTTFDNVNKLPEHQTSFVKGTGGNLASFAAGTSTSFGPNADSLKWTGAANQWDVHGDIVNGSNPAGTIKFSPYDNAKQFFRTGVTQSHNIALDGGNDNTTYRFSYSNLNQTGIVPNSSFTRNSFRVNVDSKLTDQFKVGTSLSYIVSGGDRIQEGSNLSGVMLGLMRTPISFDNSFGASSATDSKSYLFPSGFQRTYRGVGDGLRGYYDNPYWTINNNRYKDQVNRILGNVYASYDVLPWLNITDRVGIDQYSDDRKQNFAIYSAASKPGSVTYDHYSFQSLNNDLIATLSHKLTKSLNGSLLLGNNFYDEKYHHENSNGSTLIIPNFYDLGNTSAQTTYATSYVLRKKSYFAQAKFDYKNFLFIDAGLRAENSSAFVSPLSPNGKWVYFPSVNGSFIFSDALKLNQGILSFGKIRASYGQAGRLPRKYATNTYYSSQTIADGSTSGLTYPINGQQGFFAGGLGNVNLKPEVTSSTDIGTELKFFKGRVGIDFTYYTSKSKNLLLDVPLAPSTGYGSGYTNAASITNHGIEVVLSLSPIQTKSFTWDITANWSMNRSLVTNLGAGVQTLFLGGFTNGAINAVAGKPFGQIYGIGYVKDAKGNTIINDVKTNAFYGFPIVDPNSKALGDPNAKWIGGIQNKFTYKNLRFSFLFDTRQKFDMWNGTRGAMVNFGTAKETETRGQAKVFTGVPGHLDANGAIVETTDKNTVSVKPGQSWFQTGGSGFSVNEPFIEHVSFWKLREVSIGYSINLEKVKGNKIIKGIEFSLIGRNLLLFTNYKGVDPETSLAGGGALGIDYFNNPSTRAYGMNVKFNF